MIDEDVSHLGGYMSGEHGDEATYYPDLWRWLVEGPLQVRTVLDVGCGEGHSLRFFRELGCDVTGIDGIEQEDEDIQQWDYSKGAAEFSEVYDLVWCCEFVEHVDETHIKNVVPSLLAGKVMLMTHAFPGQLGHHHVNCRVQEYWLGLAAGIGLTYSLGLTAKTRELASKNRDQYNHFTRSGLAFRRNDVQALP